MIASDCVWLHLIDTECPLHQVHTLELTEMGFSMLAWPEGPHGGGGKDGGSGSGVADGGMSSS